MTFDAAPSAPSWFTPGGELDARLELLVGGTWTNFSSRVFQDSTTIQRGHPDESTTASPSTFAGTIDNHDGVLSSLNPLSQYYGLLGLNTPMRSSIPDASTHLRLEVDQVSGATCPTAAGINVAGDFEVWADVSLDNWYTSQTIAAKWVTAGNERSWMLNTIGDGTVQLIVSKDGTTGTAVFARSTVTVPKVHGRLSIRVSYVSSTGTFTFYTGQYCSNWVQLGAAPSIGSSYTLFASTAPVEVGVCAGQTDFPEVGCNGKIYAFALIPSVGGAASTAVAAADFTALTAGVTTFTDSAGNHWSLEGSAEVSNRDYRFHGESAAWPQTWTPGDANARIGLSASGLLRRIGQSNAAVNSPMWRAYVRLTGGFVPKAYWPCEDLSASTQLASGIGGAPMRFSGTPNLASSSAFACSASLPVLNGSTWTGQVPNYTVAGSPGNGSDAVARFLMAVPAGGDTNGALIARVYYTGGTVARIDLTYGSANTFTLIGFDANGAQLWTTGAVSWGGGINGQLLRVSIEIRNMGSGTYNAAVVTVAPSASVGNETFGAGTLTTGIAGTVGAIRQVVINPGATLLTSTAIGHVSVQNTWSSLFNMGAALAAYAGEAAGIRFQRLCGEEGIQFRGIGKMADTVPMGVQTLETVATLLQECADADFGMWFEPRQCLGWGYRTRASLGNQLAQVAFDYNQDQLSDDLQPTVDDQTPKNDVTVTNQGGGSTSRQTLNDGSAMSIGVIGRYDTQFTINLANDSQLDSEAGWYLHAHTVNEPRYKAINTDLANSAIVSLYWAILEADMGDRITVKNPPIWLPPGLVDQLAQGVTEIVSRKALSESWNGIPCTPWNVAYADDVVYGRADTDGSTLVSGVSSTATAINVATSTAGSPLWTTSAADLPFDIGIAGERMTVTDISGAPVNFLSGQNSSFDGGIGTWVGTGAVTNIAASTAQAHSGPESMSLTATGAGTLSASHCTAGNILTQGMPCVAGNTVLCSAWFESATVSRTVQVGAAFYDSGGTLLGAGAVLATGAATVIGQWSKVTGTVTAPASAAFCRLWVQVNSAAGVGELHYVDDAYIGDVTTGVAQQQTFTVTRSVNGVVKAQLANADARLWIPSIISL